MFKSVFAKYICAFMVIIIASFLLLSIIAAAVVNGNAESVKYGVVDNAADTVVRYFAEKIITTEELRDYTAANRDDVGTVLRATAGYSDDIRILLVDCSGVIFMTSTYETTDYREDNDLRIPDVVMLEFMDAGVVVREIDRIDGLFDNTQITAARPVYGQSDTLIGSVYVCASSAAFTNLNEVITKAVFMASLWVALAALIAVYFITDKVIGPLKNMSRAARSFAAGDFTVRVPVRGHDEVAELATAFNNMAQSLEASEKMRNTFMANVSHDLRTPMTTIAGFIDGILDGVIPQEKHEYYLNIIKTEVRRLSRLVAQLLDISRIEAGDRKFNKQTFNICETARQILISFEQKIDQKKLDVEFNCEYDNMYVNADRDAIYQILYNICDNAVKFSSEEGSLRIDIRDLGKSTTEVCVYNEGQGIKPEDLPYVFERFYKGDKSRGLDKSGVGLGLFIAKTIIEAHNQKISVSSEYGKNCEFRFTLERVKEATHE